MITSSHSRPEREALECSDTRFRPPRPPAGLAARLRRDRLGAHVPFRSPRRDRRARRRRSLPAHVPRRVARVPDGARRRRCRASARSPLWPDRACGIRLGRFRVAARAVRAGARSDRRRALRRGRARASPPPRSSRRARSVNQLLRLAGARPARRRRCRARRGAAHAHRSVATRAQHEKSSAPPFDSRRARYRSGRRGRIRVRRYRPSSATRSPAARRRRTRSS